jgi:hypothetical protein
MNSNRRHIKILTKIEEESVNNIYKIIQQNCEVA